MRGAASWALALAVCALTVGAVSSTWAKRQLLDTEVWTTHSVEVLRVPAVQEITASFLADQVVAQQDAVGAIAAALPPALQGLAGSASSVLRALAERTALQALRTGALDGLWADASRSAHEAFVRWLEGRDQRRRGAVVELDLQPAITRLARRAGIPEAAIVAGQAAAGARATVAIVNAGDYERTRRGAQRLEAAASATVPLAALAALLSVAVARRRRAAVARVGVAVVAGGLLVVALAPTLGTRLTESLTTGGAAPAVSDAIWASVQPGLAQLAWFTVIGGAALTAAAWVTRPRRRAAERG